MIQRVANQSQGEISWIQDGLTFTELIRQEYGANNCVFSAGFVEGHSVDTCYLAWKKDGDGGGMLLLTPDELAAVSWCASGALWSILLDQRLALPLKEL